MSDAATLRIQHAVNDACPWSGRPIAAAARVIDGAAVVGGGDWFPLAVGSVETALKAHRAANAGLDQ